MKTPNPGVKIHFRLLFPFSIFVLQCSIFNFLIPSGGLAAEGDPSAGNRTVISGVVTDEAGRPLAGASVRLERNGSDVVQTRTDSTGSYRMSVVPLAGRYDLSAAHGDLGDWLLNVPLREGDHKTINLTLKKAVSLSGRVSTPDSAMADVPVQAVLDRSGDLRDHPYTIAVTLTDKEGRYRFINLKPGRYQLWCVMPGERISSEAGKNTAPTVQIERGKTLTGIDFRLGPLRRRAREAERAGRGSSASASPAAATGLRPLLEAKTYTARDGAYAFRFAVADTQGYTWFGPSVLLYPTGGQLYRFDGRQFTAIDTMMGSGRAYDTDGKVWTSGWSNGIVRLYDGKVEKHYTTHDGLPSNGILALRADRREGVWAMTTRGIVHIHKENGQDRVQVVVDSSMIYLPQRVPAEVNMDSEGGVWWWVGQSPDSTTTLHRLLKTQQGISEVQKIQFSFGVTTAYPVGPGLLIKGIRGPLIYYSYSGGEPGLPLDNRLEWYCGRDVKGRLYFTTRAEDGLIKIIRDAPDSAGCFGGIDSPRRLEFPMKLPDRSGLGKVRDEMWVFRWPETEPGFVIRGDDMLPAKELYSFDLTGGHFVSTDDETVWMLNWGKQGVTELRFSKGVEYEVCDPVPDELTPLQYNGKTGTYYFLVGYSGDARYAIYSYQNREWKELLRLPTK